MEKSEEQNAPETQENGHEATDGDSHDEGARPGKPPKHLPRPTRR